MRDRDSFLRLLRDPLLWEAPVVLDAAELAAIVAEVDAEQGRARELCDRLLTGPSAAWMPRFTATPEARTPDVVLQLLARVPALRGRLPHDALRATAIAVAIAETLDPRQWSDHALLARGQALREHASLLASRGRYREALPFVESAERTFAQIDAAPADLEKLAALKAAVLAETREKPRPRACPATASEPPLSAY